MVMAIGMLKAGKYEYVREEIQKIHEVCKLNGKILKVIIEIYPFLPSIFDSSTPVTPSFYLLSHTGRDRQGIRNHV